jgi:hypothetical protein
MKIFRFLQILKSFIFKYPNSLESTDLQSAIFILSDAATISIMPFRHQHNDIQCNAIQHNDNQYTGIQTTAY